MQSGGVDANGFLVGFASATPPPWVRSSTAAEAWALHLTLQEVINVPKIVTDCLGLVNAASAGFAASTAPRMANARIWRLIEDTMSGQMAPLRDALVWMPAHTTIDQRIHRNKSDLRRVTTIDWRANQLADALPWLPSKLPPRSRP